MEDVKSIIDKRAKNLVIEFMKKLKEMIINTKEDELHTFARNYKMISDYVTDITNFGSLAFNIDSMIKDK
jgi:hypothetical protein